MADYWLVNGKTTLARKASRRLCKNSRKGGLMARHRKSSKKSHRRTRRSSRRRRSFHRNSPALSLGNVMTPLLWGGAGYLASKFAGSFIERYLPNAIPAKPLVAAAVAGGVVSYAGGMAAKSGEAKAAIRVGALIPVVEAAVNMTALGRMLGTQKVLMLAPAPGGAPSGVSAALQAALSADLSEDGEEYSGY
jgi:hypothetical protein